MWSTRLAMALALALAGVAACGNPKLVEGPAGDGAAPGPIGAPSVDAPSFAPPPAPASTDAGPPPAGQSCAEDIQKAELTPVDLLLLVDASDSMSSGTPMSKYNLVRQALVEFVRDPGSAGLNLGLQFFPLPGTGSSCQTAADCGYLISPTIPPCQALRACAGMPPLKLCGARGCADGSACLPLGRCTVSQSDCTNIGEACPGGAAADRCQGLGSVCEAYDGSAYCTPGLYELLTVPISPLPSPGADRLAREMELRGPSGLGSPLRPAVEGGLNHLRKYLQAHAGHKGVFVVATDGLPTDCSRSPGMISTDDIPAVAQLIAAARSASPSIPTYAIAIEAMDKERMTLQMLATAGGTGQLITVGGMNNLSQQFLQALKAIRGQTLPCEFQIPPPKAGGAIDFGKVNVQRKDSAGSEDILYTGGADRCDPMRGGWYYDVDPAMAHPTRILTCPATCARLQAEASATVEIRYGCATRTID